MKRALSLLSAIFLLGCGTSQPGAKDEPVEQSPPPRPVDPPVIDFATWPKANEKPYHVKPVIAAACAAPSPSAHRSRGPHDQPSIIVRTNTEAFEAFRALKPLPVGSVVVKEKHKGDTVTGPPDEYTAMIKKEPGYDPEHGDWEYLYVVSRPAKTITRGKLGSCIDCHVERKDQDYLFRTYLPSVK